jgi:GNAT superfamily N-acetyltransferase
MRAQVVQVGDADVGEVEDVLAEAFFDYPVMRFVLGPENSDYESEIRTLVHLFVMARVLRGEWLFGVRAAKGLDAAAIVSRPNGPPSPPAFADLKERVWAQLGGAARARYEAFGAACAPFGPEVPHLHLNMIGARRSAQGKRLGGALLDHVHAFSRADPESEGVSLTTESRRNVTLYEHAGYSVVGHAVVSPALQTWGFYRPDSVNGG